MVDLELVSRSLMLCNGECLGCSLGIGLNSSILIESCFDDTIYSPLYLYILFDESMMGNMLSSPTPPSHSQLRIHHLHVSKLPHYIGILQHYQQKPIV